MSIARFNSRHRSLDIDGHQAAMRPAIVQSRLPHNLNKKGKEGILGKKTNIAAFRKYYLICKNVLCKFKDHVNTNAESNFIHRDITFNIKIVLVSPEI